MEYIIDGYNLIKSSFLKKYDGGPGNRALLRMMDILSSYRRKHVAEKFTVVLDGYADINYPDRKIRIVFSHESTADERIRIMLEKTSGSNRTRTVVSDDREVQACGRILGSGVMGVKNFMEMVVPPEPKQRTKKENNKPIDKVNTLSIEKELKDFYNKNR